MTTNKKLTVYFTTDETIIMYITPFTQWLPFNIEVTDSVIENSDHLSSLYVCIDTETVLFDALSNVDKLYLPDNDIRQNTSRIIHKVMDIIAQNATEYQDKYYR